MSFFTQIKVTSVAVAVAAAIPSTLFGLWKVEQERRRDGAIIKFGDRGHPTAERKSESRSSFVAFDLPQIGTSVGHGSGGSGVFESYGYRNILESSR